MRLIWSALNNSRFYQFVPHGFDVFFDIKKHVSPNKFKVVFDVGANVGQSVYRISHAFPYADIYCFEPILSTFNQLRDNTKRNDHVQCYQLALGSRKETASVALQQNSCLSSLVRKIEMDSGKALNLETVHVDTLNRFCEEHNIEHIDYLKIDTEGFDLEVLKGGQKMLDSGAVTFIQVEAGISYTYKEHIPFQQFRQYLEKKGYVLFGIYEQTLEYTGELRLKYCNAVFVLEKQK
jgi:FkbM family methyltransferase